MVYGLTTSDYIFAAVVFLIFIVAVVVLVFVAWKSSKQKGGQ